MITKGLISKDYLISLSFHPGLRWHHKPRLSPTTAHLFTEELGNTCKLKALQCNLVQSFCFHLPSEQVSGFSEEMKNGSCSCTRLFAWLYEPHVHCGTPSSASCWLYVSHQESAWTWNKQELKGNNTWFLFVVVCTVHRLEWHHSLVSHRESLSWTFLPVTVEVPNEVTGTYNTLNLLASWCKWTRVKFSPHDQELDKWKRKDGFLERFSTFAGHRELHLLYTVYGLREQTKMTRTHWDTGKIMHHGKEASKEIRTQDALHGALQTGFLWLDSSDISLFLWGL